MTSHSAKLTSGSTEPESLSHLLFPLSDSTQRRFLEEFRIEYERVHGPTDITKRYTSTWPNAEQNWLIEHEPRQWFNGLPPFAKAFLRGKMEMAAREGNLDDMPDRLLRLYVSKQMQLDHESRHR